MKKLFLLLVLPIVAYSQSTVTEGKFKIFTGSTVVNRTYTNSTADTLAWLNVGQYTKKWFNIQSKDSAKLVITYSVAFDTTAYPTKASYDSLITISNSGGFLTKDFTTIVGGFPFIRFYVTASGAGGAGTTTNTYTAGYKLEK